MTPPRLSLAAMLIAVTNLIPSLAVLRGSMRLCDRDFTPQDIQAEINKGANVRGRDKDGFTLHLAAYEGNAKAVNFLLQAGANIEAKNNWGATPLYQAGKVEAITTLLQAGADIEARTEGGFTPLHGAARLGNAETITTLIKAGADIEAKAEDGDTLLHMAALSGRAEAITVLIEAGANGKAKDKDGRTPFDYAKHNEKLKDTDAYRLLKAAQY